MSATYWTIDGYGLDANELKRFINTGKCVSFLQGQLNNPDIKESDFNLDDYLYSSPYDCFAEMLTYLDDTDSLTYCNGCDERSFLYYPATYPWHMSDTDPRSEYEVRERIYNAVSQIFDVDKRTLDDMTGYIGEVGID